MKFCNRCKQEKARAAFHIRRASKDGLAAMGKDCQREYDRSRADAPQRVAARIAYMHTESGKQARARAAQKFVCNYPSKRKAQVIANNALRDGKLVRPDTCEHCGQKETLQAHHCDYSKPLDVMWLCVPCHSAWHRKFTPVYPELQRGM